MNKTELGINICAGDWTKKGNHCQDCQLVFSLMVSNVVPTGVLTYGK